jgi:hypothetical protein
VAYAAQNRLLSLMMANIEQSTGEVQVLIFDDLVIVKVIEMGFKDEHQSSYRAGGDLKPVPARQTLELGKMKTSICILR